ncbi:DUF2982 domain-containing protein [Pleionea sediminis]|uniref:DUF2982 domain-containing protein n=1 Tax=Pleionea sediminis TaxID=2569479 RepID=UPI0013DE6737|nr:DUF2982 domain-containing protein [Pleionea sediminis]
MIDKISIKPIARRNHLIFTLVGIVFLTTSLVLQQFGIKLPAYLLMLVGFVLFIFGIFKWQEPKTSLELSSSGIIWFHKFGSVLIEWDNLIDLVPLRINSSSGYKELHYIGVKVWDRTPIIKTVPLRLAKSLYHEYRSLLHVALLEAQYRNDDTSQLQEDAESWKTPSGEKIDGLRGIFAARLNQLKHFLGADLYIPLTALDRNQDDFLDLYKQYKEKVIALKLEQS